jgi:pimeloyl-ACP methyl ester carboxylesterase
MRKKLKMVVKIISAVLLLLLLLLTILFYRFSSPESDKNIIEKFEEMNVEVFIKNRQFKKYTYRILEFQKEIDTTLPIIVFIHGSIGSSLDFKRYLSDNEIINKANLISYDRIGYGIHHTGKALESIAIETEMLHDLLSGLNKGNIILVGYSYGGPIALASINRYKKIILLAPAVYSKVEPMPWALNLYIWKISRWLLPEIWKSASKEKLSHKKDLQRFENNWNKNPSQIISIHGDKDWIAPIENSFYLKEKFSLAQFELVTLNNAGHGLVWSNFDDIKKMLLQQLN